MAGNLNATVRVDGVVTRVADLFATFGVQTSAGTGTVTSIVAGTGLTGGTITTTGTIALSPTGLAINSFSSVVTADTQSTSTWTVNLTTSNWHTITLTQSIATLTLTGGTDGQQFTLVVIQGGSGSYTMTWPTTTKWPGGTPPTLTTTVGGIDVFTFKRISSSVYYGFIGGQALA